MADEWLPPLSMDDPGVASDFASLRGIGLLGQSGINTSGWRPSTNVEDQRSPAWTVPIKQALLRWFADPSSRVPLTPEQKASLQDMDAHAAANPLGPQAGVNDIQPLLDKIAEAQAREMMLSRKGHGMILGKEDAAALPLPRPRPKSAPRR